jgi:hypothetical protein
MPRCFAITELHVDSYAKCFGVPLGLQLGDRRDGGQVTVEKQSDEVKRRPHQPVLEMTIMKMSDRNTRTSIIMATTLPAAADPSKRARRSSRGRKLEKVADRLRVVFNDQNYQRETA